MKHFYKLIIVASCCLAFSSNAQLIMKSSENYSSYSQNIAIDEENRIILKDEFVGSSNRLTKNGSPLGSVSSSERLVHTSKGFFFTLEKGLNKNTNILRKYTINNSSAQVGNISYKNETFLIFFESGSFAIADASEAGGREVKIYSSTFNLLKTLSPFKDGYEYVQYHVYKNTLLLGFMSGQTKPRLTAIDNTGSMLFDQVVETEGELSMVAASDKYFAVYCFNDQTGSNDVFTYNQTGQLQWRKDVGSPPKQWGFFNSGLVIGTTVDLITMDKRTGMVQDHKKLSDIFVESNLQRIRKDNYLEINDLQATSNGDLMNVLISEPTSLRDYKNIILFSFKEKLKMNNQFFIGDSHVEPLLKNSGKEILVITDNKILKYGH